MAKTFGASTLNVYETLRDLANKDQQGFITATEFNRFAQVAQLNIFNGLFDELKDAKRLSRAGFNPTRDKSRTKRIEEDLASFSVKTTLTKSNGIFSVSASATAKPMARIIGIATAGSILMDTSTKKPIEICYDEEKIERILISNLSSPTEEFPVALVSEDIYVFPTSINKIEVRYYKYPAGRVANTGVRSDSQPTYVAGGVSIDFELPEHYTADLVYEIGRMVGLNLRDKDVTAYAGTEHAAKKQAQTY
jgi:hypothetical protein